MAAIISFWPMARGTEPLYRQLEDQIRVQILDGRLPAGSRLPSIRELARELGIARVTVMSAYAELVGDGYLVAKVGSGHRVARRPGGHDVRAASHGVGESGRQTHPQFRPLFTPDRPLNVYRDERPLPGSLPYDFRPGRPSMELFPHTAWERLLREAWRELSGASRSSAADYADPAGHEALREACATHLGAVRAARCGPEDILITSGAQSAFDVASRLFLGPGRTCIVEDPGYAMSRRAASATGARIMPVPVDGQGLIVERLPDDQSTSIVTPSWQYPMGGSMPYERRLELLRWATATSSLVIEDDYEGDLWYDGMPPPCLQSLDEAGQVIYIGTFSKVAFPGIRLGYVIVPRAIREPFSSMLELSQRGVSILEQLAMAAFIQEGRLEAHMRKLRSAFADRQRVMLDTIARELGDRVSTAAQAGGKHLLVTLTSTAITATEVSRAARLVGVWVTPLSSTRVKSAPDRELIVGYTAVTPSEMTEGMRRLAGVIDRAAQDPEAARSEPQFRHGLPAGRGTGAPLVIR